MGERRAGVGTGAVEGSLGEERNESVKGKDRVHVSSRKRGVLGQFTIHMVQLYTDQPYMWLEHEHHPCSNHMYG